MLEKIFYTIFFSKRAKSFYWRAGVSVGLLFTAHVSDVLPGLELPEMAVVLVGYFMNEITKYLNSKKT